MKSNSAILGLVNRIKTERRWSLIALFLVLAAGAYYDAYLLMRYPVATGVDGYYYVLQVDSLRQHGHLYFPTRTPLTLYALLGLSYLIESTILAVKLGSIILHALLCLGIFAVVVSVTRSAWLGLLGSALAATSGLHLYLVGEFVNNLGAVTLLVWCGWSAIRAGRNRSMGWAGVSVLCLFAAVFSHRSALFLVLIVATSSILVWSLINPYVSSCHRQLTLMIVIVIWTTPVVAAVQPFLHLPGWVSKELTAIPKWPLDQSTSPEGLILLLAASAILFLLWRSQAVRSNHTAAVVFGTVALASLLVTLNPFLNPDRGSLGIAGRLRVLAYIQAAIAVPGLIWFLLQARRVLVVYAAALILPLIFLSTTNPIPFGLRSDYLASRMRTIKYLNDCRPLLGPSTVIIAPHGEQFVISSVLGVPSQQLVPEDASNQSVWWLIHQADLRLMPPSAVVLGEETEGRYLAIIKDEDLRHLLGDATGIAPRQLLEANSHLRRQIAR